MTTTGNSIIVGIFQDEANARIVINELRNMGLSNDQIGVAMREEGTTRSIREDYVNVGVPQNEADYYQSEFEQGNTIISVRPDGRQQEVSDLFSRYGALGSSTGTNQTATDFASTTTGQAYAGSSQGAVDYSSSVGTNQPYDTTTGDERSLRLREEQLLAQKQQVQSGEVRLGKEVVSEQQTLNVPTTREEVYIERRPGTGQVSDTPVGTDETINVPVSKEQVYVEKQPVVREEIALGKRAVQENQQVSDTVQHEEARIERSGDVNVQGTNVDDMSDQTIDNR